MQNWMFKGGAPHILDQGTLATLADTGIHSSLLQFGINYDRKSFQLQVSGQKTSELLRNKND